MESKSSILPLVTISLYTWKLFLEDDDKRTNKKNELEDILGSYEEAVKTQEEYINDLLGRKYE